MDMSLIRDLFSNVIDAAEKLGVNPKDCLVFEDTEMGIQAATGHSGHPFGSSARSFAYSASSA